MTIETISVIVGVSQEGDATKGGFYGDQDAEAVLLPVEKLRTGLKAETSKLLTILDAIPEHEGWRLDEVEIGAEITAEGGISFIGTAKIGARTAFKLKFKR
jgi:hypothetical protein